MIVTRLAVPTKRPTKRVLNWCFIIIKFLISTIGPMMRKATVGATPKLESKEAPIKASASEQSERIKAKSIMIRMAVTELCPIVVRIRVGR